MGPVLIVSAHDARSKRKANIHFIAEEMSRRTKVRWFSAGFSQLSKLRGRDPRLGLEGKANHLEVHQEMDCFLWRTAAHPGNIRLRVTEGATAAWFVAYQRKVPALLMEWAKVAEVIFVESGFSVLFIRQLREAAPSARIIYIASDDLETIGTDKFLQRLFVRDSRYLTSARVPALELSRAIPPGVPTFYVPHGIDPALSMEGSSPFRSGREQHAVSVGSMLFDPSFFHIACALFPDIRFHVIGSGVSRRKLPEQVVDHGELPFGDTLPYIQHSAFGIAPYKTDRLPYYIAGSSMKLMQYDYCGLPSVCPAIAVGRYSDLRCGYIPGDAQSIRVAIETALAKPHASSKKFLSWSEVVDRLIAPDRFPDTVLGGDASP